MNELLLFVKIIVIFSMLLITKKLFGKYGLIGWIGVASVLANIMVVKSVNIFGISATLGNVLFASNFLATDILSENYGKKYAKIGVNIGLFSIICFIIISQLALLFTPNEIDIAQESMINLFSLAPRVCISSLIMYYIANRIDVYLYDKLKNKTKLFVRNNICTIVCNCTENFGFTFLAFAGIYSFKDLIMIALSTSLIEIIIAICDTPFLYLSRQKSKNMI